MIQKQLKTIVFGQKRTATLRILLLSIGLFLVVFGTSLIGTVTGVQSDILETVFETIRNVAGIDEAYVVAFGLVGLGAVNAYYNDGLVVSWALVFAPVFAVLLWTPPLTELSAVELLANTAGLGLIFTVVLGTVGYVLGAGIRRIRPKNI